MIFDVLYALVLCFSQVRVCKISDVGKVFVFVFLPVYYYRYDVLDKKNRSNDKDKIVKCGDDSN